MVSLNFFSVNTAQKKHLQRQRYAFKTKIDPYTEKIVKGLYTTVCPKIMFLS